MTAEPTPTPPTFDDLKLSEPLRRAIAEAGYTSPTSVQTAVFHPIADGKDIMVQSKTGSGKTAAFAIPLLDRVVQPERRVQAMVLCPTRELALQVANEVARLGKFRGVATTAIYGGAPIQRQIDELAAGAQFVVGTPGRVLDHLRRGTLDVKGLRVICLDEADEMLSMGFAEELNAILEFVPKKRQGLLFSATMPESIQRLARRHLTDPELISLSTDQVAPTEVTHFVYYIIGTDRTHELARIIEIEKPEGAIIFCNTKDETSKVAAEMQKLGLSADFLNGDLEQSSRERVLSALRSGKLQYLVATDVAARGIDISKLSHVINYGFPDSAEQYVHRTGRTGRAGRTGTAISLITPKDVGNLYFLRLTYGIRPIERELPSGTEVRTRRELDRIKMLREAFANDPGEEAVSLAKRLLTHDDAERMVALLVGEFFNIAMRQAIARVAPPAESLNRAAPAEVEPRSPPANRPPRGKALPPAGAERPRRIDVHHGADVVVDDEGPESGMEEIRLAVGRRDGVRAGDIARVMRERAKLARRDVGRIFVRDRFSLVSVRAELRDSAIEALRDAQIADRPLLPERGKSVNPSDRPPAGDTANTPQASVRPSPTPSTNEPDDK